MGGKVNALSRISPLEREYEQAQQNFDRLTSYLDSEEALAMSHSELERELEKRGRELMRLLLQEHLDKRSPGQCDRPVKDADGVKLTITRPQQRKIETVFGTVTVERVGYGLKGTQSLHPLDAELNLPDDSLFAGAAPPGGH